MKKYSVFVGKVYVMRVFADNEALALIEAERQLSKPGRQHVLKNGRLTVEASLDKTDREFLRPWREVDVTC